MTIRQFHSVIFKRGVWRAERTVMCEDLGFKHPFTCIISGPSGSGKSSFWIKLLQNLKSLSNETRFDGGILGATETQTPSPLLTSEGKYCFTKVCQTIS